MGLCEHARPWSLCMRGRRGVTDRALRGIGFRVCGLGFRVEGLGFKGLGFKGLGFKGLGLRVLGV